MLLTICEMETSSMYHKLPDQAKVYVGFLHQNLALPSRNRTEVKPGVLL